MMRIESDCTNLGLIDEKEEEEGIEVCVNGSDDLRSVQEMQEDQNICKFPESSVNASVSRRKVSKSVNKGFNLRKSLAWNPAFFTEEGVLEPSELSYITGSNGFQKTGERSVLNEVYDGSCEKKSNQNSQLRFQNGRKLFCTPESSKKGARSINSRLPRPPITNSQKRVANTNATGHIPKVPKFTAGNGNITPNSKNSNISKNIPTIKKEQSNIKKTSLLPPKPSNKIISKTVLKPPAQPSQPALNVNKNDNNNCDNNENVGPSARILMKPSALKMPSPSFGFFSRGKVSPQPSTNSQTNTDNKSLNSTTKAPNSKLPLIPPPSAKCQTPIGRVASTKLNTPSTSIISKIQIGQKSVMQMGKFDRARNSSSKKEKGERSIRVLKLKERKSGGGKIRVCEEAKEGRCGNGKIRVCEEEKEEMCFDGKIRVCEEAKEEACSNGKIRFCEEETCSNGKMKVCEESKEEIGKIRVYEESKEEISSNGKITVCEESTEKENNSVETQLKTPTKSKSTLTESKSNRTEDPNKEEKFTNQILCNLDCTSIEKQQKSKRKSSVYGFSPLKNNKRDKTVFSPHKTKEIDGIEKSKETCSNGKLGVCEKVKEEILSNGKIRVCEETKEEMSSNGEISFCEESKEGSTSEIRVCEETKEDYSVQTQLKNELISSETSSSTNTHIITLTESKSNVVENRTEDLIEEKFTHQIPCNLESSLIEKQKSKRKSSVYGLSPLRNNKRDKTVFLPHKRKEIEKLKAEKSNTETEKSKEGLKAEETMSIDEKKRADCLTKCRKDLVPFSDEWFAALETFGEEILEKKTGAVQNSPPDKTAPEPSPWSPVKRKVQELGPYDCTKYSKTVPSDAEK